MPEAAAEAADVEPQVSRAPLARRPRLRRERLQAPVHLLRLTLRRVVLAVRVAAAGDAAGPTSACRL
jgi:hypothetical protein